MCISVACFWFLHSCFFWSIWRVFYDSGSFLIFGLVSIPWLLITAINRNKNWGVCLTLVIVDDFMREEKQKCSCFPVCSPCLHPCQFQPGYSELTFVICLGKTEQSFWKQSACEYVCVYFFLCIVKLIFEQLLNNRLVSIKYFHIVFTLCFDLL